MGFDKDDRIGFGARELKPFVYLVVSSSDFENVDVGIGLLKSTTFGQMDL